MPRLVTTALSERIAEDEEIVLLGEWCRLYGSGDTARKNAPIVPYHWDDREKLAKDFEYLQRLNQTLLKDIAFALNKLHNLTYSDHYWHLLLGCWLNQFTTVLYDRWSCLQSAIKSFGELKSSVKPFAEDLLIPQDTGTALSFFLQDWWNHALISVLMREFAQFEVTCDGENDFLRKPGVVKKNEIESHRRVLKRWFKRKILELLSLALRWNKYSLYYPGLSFRQEIVACARLGTMPHLMRFPELGPAAANMDFRKWSLTPRRAEGSFGKVVRSLVPLLIPKIFLEGYSEARELASMEGQPKRVRSIFSCTSHFTDDVFKIWAAGQREGGARLVVGQHGGGAFHRFNGMTSYELSVCDTYVSTGDGNCHIDPRIKDVGRFNNRLALNAWKPDGHGILVTVAMPRYAADVRAMPLAGQMLAYFDDQYAFYEKLQPRIRETTFVRIYPKDYGWDQKGRWLKRFPDVLLDEGEEPMRKKVACSRLFISTYNATTYNETLAANIPTVMYWDENYWELSQAAKPWFNQLKAVGIFHGSPDSAALHVNAIWDDVGQWWYSAEVQHVRNEFCRRFAHLSPCVLKKLVYVIKSASAKR